MYGLVGCSARISGEVFMRFEINIVRCSGRGSMIYQDIYTFFYISIDDFVYIVTKFMHILIKLRKSFRRGYLYLLLYNII